MDTQCKARPTLPVLARGVSGCLNSAFLNISQHFTGHLFRPWIPSSARDIDGGPRRLTKVVLNEQSLPARTNKIVLKLYQNTQGWEFCVRFVTADGQPVPFKQKRNDASSLRSLQANTTALDRCV
jgi:hypothetical protein